MLNTYKIFKSNVKILLVKILGDGGRKMSIYYLKQEIQHCEQRILELQTEIKKCSLQIEDLNDMLYKFQKQYNVIQDNIYRRKRNIETVQFDSKQIKMYQIYKRNMEDLLTGTRFKRILQQQEESQAQIKNNLNRINNQINKHQNEIKYLENRISSLNYEIYLIRLEEDK